MAKEQHIERTHPLSKRTAIVEDDGSSAWLYLTRPDSLQPVCDCWIYNRISPPDPGKIDLYRGGPPPACIGFADANDVYATAEGPTIHLVWSASGEDVAVFVDGIVLAFASAQLSSGYAKLLLRSGPWGRTWNQTMYDVLFNDGANTTIL